MIFVTVGTHPDQFDRLVKRIDSIAPEIEEEIVVQRGFTKYVPKNVKSFDFADNLDEYFKKARISIIQSATSLIEFSLNYKKPVITVPRQKKFKEHINDHQVEFAEYFSRKTGIKAIYDVKELTPDLLKKYKTVPKIDTKGLKNLQDFMIQILNETK